MELDEIVDLFEAFGVEGLISPTYECGRHSFAGVNFTIWPVHLHSWKMNTRCKWCQRWGPWKRVVVPEECLKLLLDNNGQCDNCGNTL